MACVAGVAQLVGGEMGQANAGPGSRDDLVQPSRAQRLIPAETFQHHEGLLGHRRLGALTGHVLAQLGEEPR